MEKEITLYRKAYNDLKKWKNKKNHLPLIIRGLRQIGKSFLAEKFAYENYDKNNVIVLDFRHNKNLDIIFSTNPLMSKPILDQIIDNIKLMFPNKKIEKGKTCFVMDEIGDSKFAREYFKVFGSNSGYDIISTGSLLGLSEIKGEPLNTPIGYEEYLDLKPLDFEEFLIASGVSEDAINVLKKHAINNEELNDTYANVFKSHLLRYIVVGGMPNAIKIYLETGDLFEVRKYLNNLRKDYEDDFGKYKDEKGNTKIDTTLLIRTIRAYRSIPDQLAKENSKFKYSQIQNGGRSSEFSDALAWLEKTDIIRRSHNLKSIELPLEGNAISDEFKVFPTDIGLLVSSYPFPIVEEIINDKLGAHKGAIYESLIADFIYKAGLNLYYFSNTKKHFEIDFVVEENNSISIIEAKSNNGKIVSSKNIINTEIGKNIKNVYKVLKNNFGKGDFYYSIPHYALPFLLQKIYEDTHHSLILPEIEKI